MKIRTITEIAADAAKRCSCTSCRPQLEKAIARGIREAGEPLAKVAWLLRTSGYFPTDGYSCSSVWAELDNALTDWKARL